MSPATVTHNAAAQRFELTVDGLLCEATYRLQDGVMWMNHTGVPSALEGRGLASQLVSAAVAHAREQGLKIKPVCSYVAVWMRRHPEAADLLA
ncbi:MAG: GNAT family N-acetyltransferase [Ideonella sp. MAG2]|nr:MAG: GNAT family N-acetyltransferase [Ideonella sp. MAG2]